MQNTPSKIACKRSRAADTTPRWLRRRRRLGLRSLLPVKFSTTEEDAMLWIELEQRRQRRGDHNPNTYTFQIRDLLVSWVDPPWAPRALADYKSFVAWAAMHATAECCARQGLNPRHVPTTFEMWNLTTGKPLTRRAAP